MTPQPALPHRLPLPENPPNPELPSPPVAPLTYSHSCPTVNVSGGPTPWTRLLPAVSAADPSALGSAVAGEGALNTMFVHTPAWSTTPPELGVRAVRTTVKVLPTTVKVARESTVSVPLGIVVPVSTIRVACAPAPRSGSKATAPRSESHFVLVICDKSNADVSLQLHFPCHSGEIREI